MSKINLNTDKNYEMLCKGCAAKISIDVIKNAIPKELSHISSDATLIPTSKNFYQSIDILTL